MRLVQSLAFVVVVVSLVACGDRHPGGPDGGGVDGGTDDGATADAPDLCVGGTLCGLASTCCPAGNECVLDQCVAACATGIYCGQDLGTCCAAGQVCLEDACVNPGAACADPYDCEPGFFCEPTLGQCLPQPDPLTCQLQPTFTDLQVTPWSVPGILAEMGVGAIMQQQPPLDVKLEAIKRYAGQVIARFA